MLQVVMVRNQLITLCNQVKSYWVNTLLIHPTSLEISMPVEQPSPGNSSFLLRLRRAGTHPAIRHVSLQDVCTGEWHQFIDLAQLFALIE